MPNKKIQAITKIALLTAVLCISSYFVIPLPFSPVVLSLQTVFVNLTALMLTPRQSFICVLVYLFLGAIGLPVFSMGSSGVGKLLGQTGGFYFGFLLSAPAISLAARKGAHLKTYILTSVLIGIPIQHIFAILVFSLHNSFNLEAAFTSVSLPFILGDIIKCVLSSVLAREIEKRSRFLHR